MFSRAKRALMFSLIAVVFAAPLGAGGDPTAPATKRSIQSRGIVDTPASLQKLTDVCAVVVEIEVVTTRTFARPFVNGINDVFTEINARVLTVAKGTVSPGQSITILQRAGRVETAGEVIEVDGETPVAKDARYVVFLNWNKALDSFVVFGSDGIFQIRSGIIVKPFGRSEMAKRQSGRSVRSFLEEVRSREKDLRK